MTMLLTGLFFFITLFCRNVLGKNPCNIGEVECMTTFAAKHYSNVLYGKFEGLPSSDPLHVDVIEANLPSMKYTVRNVALHGLGKCVPNFVNIEPKIKMLYYYFSCGEIYIEGQYEMKGNMDSMYAEGQGDFIIHYYDIVIKLNETIEQSKADDNKIHLHCNDFTYDIDINGKVVYDFKNLFNGDAEKSAALHKYINAKGKETNAPLKEPLMQKFMSELMKNVNIFFKVKVAEDIFPTCPHAIS